jgi:hypothetical protein
MKDMNIAENYTRTKVYINIHNLVLCRILNYILLHN